MLTSKACSSPNVWLTKTNLMQAGGEISQGVMRRLAASWWRKASAKKRYQQCLAISKRLIEHDKSNSSWQRDLIVAPYKVGKITAKIRGDDSVTQAQGFLRTALNLAELYAGPDRQTMINTLNLALQSLVHPD
jgi:hypothetical protein